MAEPKQASGWSLMGARGDLDRLTDVADWTQGHNHQLVDFCDTICPRWATHAPWQCDPGGGCPKHHPGGNDEPEAVKLSEGLTLEPACSNADCEFGPIHPHGPACTATCGVCHPDDDVVEALIIPKRPSEIRWEGDGWRVGLVNDGHGWGIYLAQTGTLHDEEIEAANTAYESARWFRDHLAELHIG